MTSLFNESTAPPLSASDPTQPSFPVARISTERVVTLPSDDDLHAWRRAARRLLAEAVPPEKLVWRLAGHGDLFASDNSMAPAMNVPPIKVPKAAASLVGTAIHHASRERFELLYRFLWRSLEDRHLASNMADRDTAAVHRLAKSVRRDAHKMHAFVRFRKVGEENGREQYAAWFEPDHYITEREAPFFARRFANMDWMIVTPRRTAIYRDGRVFFAQGGRREDVPADDAFEDAWRAYYASIFNPARIMTHAMRAEMPKKYWKNLPEARLIPDLLEQAPRRVAAMRAAALAANPASVSANMIRIGNNFPDLAALKRAILMADLPEAACASGRVVLGEGPHTAHLFLIGEQPGEQEDQAGRPFVGPAGKMLDVYLQRAGIDRSCCYLTNAVKRFHFAERGKRRIHQTPKAGEVDFWSPYLLQEHGLVRPQVTVTLGATALRGFFGRPVRLGEVRGETIPLPDGIGGVCVPTFHPSYLLQIKDEGQREVESRKFIMDLEKARDLAFAGA